MPKLWPTIRTLPAPQLRPLTLFTASVCLLLGVILTACGSSSAGAVATTTPTCPPVIAMQTVIGTIQANTANTLTVTTSTGTTIVHLTSTTRITHQVQVAASTLTTGASVQVTTDATGITAERITVVGNARTGSGGTDGFGGATGTPGARRNAACFRRGTGGAGQGQGTFSGLRGTITSVSSTQVVLTDTQGQTFTVTITGSTVIISTTTGQASDLITGATIVAIGTKTSDGITARTITVTLHNSGASS